MTKMTYAMAIDYAICVLNGEETPAEIKPDEVFEKLEALKAQLAKRNSGERKPTKTQRENEGVKAEILEYLSDKGQQCKDIAAAVGVTGQKCSALLKQMIEAGLADKYIEKKVTYFKRA